MDMTSITQYLQPELLILVPVLYLIGNALKKAEKVADKFIPLILGVCGVVIAVIYCFATVAITDGYKGVLMILFTAVTQGILCAGASVYANQLVKQTSKEE